MYDFILYCFLMKFRNNLNNFFFINNFNNFVNNQNMNKMQVDSMNQDDSEFPVMFIIFVLYTVCTCAYSYYYGSNYGFFYDTTLPLPISTILELLVLCPSDSIYSLALVVDFDIRKGLDYKFIYISYETYCTIISKLEYQRSIEFIQYLTYNMYSI